MDIQNKNISEIASVIASDWKKVSPHARPYLDAMYSLNTLQDNFIHDSGVSVVSYFLANASTWKGEVAKEVKKELNKRVKAYYNKK